MKRLPLSATVPLLLALGTAAASAQTPPNVAPPASPVKLVFIHHSTGENWLRDDNGGLGLALRASSYFVSDTNYGWGPADADVGSETIGDHTDIGHWFNWFSGPNRSTYLAALYAESATHSEYSRLATDPGGTNRIVMIKSCFTNAVLSGSPTDPIPAIGSNPLRGQSYESATMTIANAKGIYVEILKYFATRPDVLFVVVINPPRGSFETDAENAANVRALATWLRTEWLRSYSGRNVSVFDFFNVLTSNGGSARTNDPETNDLGWSDGNHHRVSGGAYQHLRTVASDMSAYAASGDSHPTSAGNLKATGEFVPMLNAFYHCWQGDGGCPSAATTSCSISSCSASGPGSGSAGSALSFSASLASTGCTGSTTYDWDFGDGTAHAASQSPSHAYAAAGTFSWSVVMTIESQTCTRNGSVTVTGGTPPPTNLYLVPAVAHSPGAYGTLWRTDVAAINRGTSAASLTLTFVPTSGSAVTQPGGSVAASGVRELTDVLGSLFGYGSSASASGALAVASDQPLLLASRTYNQGTAGTYGGYIPGVAATGGITAGETGILPQLKRGPKVRTNIGVANLGSVTAAVQVKLFGQSGAQAGSTVTLSVPAGGMVQSADVFAAAGAGDQAIAYATVTVTTSGARVWAYASVIDNDTGDPTIVPLTTP